MIRFICFKWGTKYDHRYVNRLYSMVKQNCTLPHEFHCITDDLSGIISSIKTHDINFISDWRTSTSSIFTIEKVSAFRYGFLDCEGPYVLLDLDILIHGSLSEYLASYAFSEPRLIKNYWNSESHRLYAYGDSWVDINSSFVTWKGNQFHRVYEFYQEKIDRISRVYRSFDKSMYYLQEGRYGFHPRKIVYSYNSGAEYPDDVKPAIFRKDYKICLFNNSHGHGFDLSEVNGWPKEFWNRHDV